MLVSVRVRRMISSLRALLAWLVHARRWAMPDAPRAATHEIRAQGARRADPSIVGQAARVYRAADWPAWFIIDLPAWFPAGMLILFLIP